MSDDESGLLEMCDHSWVPYEMTVLRWQATFEGHVESIPEPTITGARTKTVVCVDCGKVKELEPEEDDGSTKGR